MSSVSVIIPTLCEAVRAASLQAAVESVLRQEHVAVVPLVVVNGTRYDADLLASLRSRAELRVHQLEQASLPAALNVGRSLVETEYFGFLDDDDLLLPDALARRLRPFEARPDLDVVVSNGWKVNGDGSRSPIAHDIADCTRDPLRALFKEYWLSSCSGLFKSRTIGPEFFDPQLAYREWTWTAFRLATSGARLAFIDDFTFEINESNASLQKSEKYLLAEPTVFRRMLDSDMPGDVRSRVIERLSDALHAIADYYLRAGKPLEAWKYHLQSLRSARGLRKYGLYTRHLVASRRGMQGIDGAANR